MPELADAQKILNYWLHLSARILEHKNSTFNRENCIKWKMLEQKIKSKITIEASLQKAIDQETNKWRHILKECTSMLCIARKIIYHSEAPMTILENQDLEFS